MRRCGVRDGGEADHPVEAEFATPEPRVLFESDEAAVGRCRAALRRPFRRPSRRARGDGALSAAAVTREGVLVVHRDGALVVPARPSEVPPDQLAASRRHKAALLPFARAPTADYGMFPGDGLEDLEVLGRDPDRMLEETVAAVEAALAWWPDTVAETPATGGQASPFAVGDAPAVYEPVLGDEERLELRRAWLEAVRPPAGR